MIKLLGFIMVVSGCGMLGVHYGQGYGIRIRLLEELEQLLQYIYGEIEYSAGDMAYIFQNCSMRAYFFCDFFEGLSGCITGGKTGTLAQFWQENMQYILYLKSLKSADRELIGELGSHIGNLDRMTQLHTLEIYRLRLEYILQDAKKNYESQKKLCSVLGVTAGFFLAVLLV